MKYRYTILIIILIFITGVIVMNLLPLTEMANCQEHKVMKKEVIDGVVKKKYIDAGNHLSPTLELMKNDSTMIDYIFYRDNSGFYDYLKENDIVKKKEGSMKVLVIRGSQNKFFILDYNCNKN